jgi:hypothetical protein
MGKRTALIAASLEYLDPKLQQLRSPAKDAERFARVLRDPDVGNFDVTVLPNRKAHIIRGEIGKFFAEGKGDDLLLLYFSCHAVKDDDGNLYFAAIDTDVDNLDGTAVSADWVSRQMTKSWSRRVLLLLDCCYSGAFASRMDPKGDDGVHIKERFKGDGRGRVVLTASDDMEYAWEGDTLSGAGQPSLFTRALVEGLETGDADLDRDGVISVDDLYEYIFDRVVESTPNQKPNKWSFDVEGDLRIARSKSGSDIALLPSELRVAIASPLEGVRESAVREFGRLLREGDVAAVKGARAALLRLAEDDSNNVAMAAQAALKGFALDEDITIVLPDVARERGASGESLDLTEPPVEEEPPAPSPSQTRSWSEALGGLFRRRRRDAEPKTSRLPGRHDTATRGDKVGSGAEPDPPRHAYARLDCADVVIATEEFELTVGLSELPGPDVVGDELTRPPSSIGPYLLAIQVVADGFELREAESWRVVLAVTAEVPHPSRTLHLRPVAGPESIKARAIRAIYSVDAQTIGMAFRSLLVAREPSLVPAAAGEPQEADIDLSIPTAWPAPDLTVRILRSESESDGRLLWTFETPHGGIALTKDPVDSDIGDDPRAFARQLIDKVNVREGRPGLYQYLIGVGRTIADEMPEPFWEALRGVAAAVDERVPTLLILSEEPHIPWELAVVDPPLDVGAPPFLSAQVEVGRWVLGRKRPPMPPPNEVAVSAMAVISGVYDRPGWARLLEAEGEAAHLQASYGAVHVNAAAGDVLGCLSGTPKADLLHFAVHGVYDPAGIQDGLVLVDGHSLDPMEVKGSQFVTRPFVFLNACQVGSGNKVLGDYAGMAEAFLWSGASGVVAPLWSVKDSIAKDVALRFYDQIFKGARVGAVLKKERAAFSSSGESPSATYLAYQYFGHPAMRLSRSS